MTSQHAIRLRYTGENPSIEALGQFPNWVNAYDEEGFEGQDETTLKPDDEQLCITDMTAFTAGEVVFADGSTFPVLIGLLNGEVTDFSVYREPEWPCLSYDDYWNFWSVRPDLKSEDRDRPERWWKLQQFPARVSSKLPLRSTGERWSVVMDGDGLVIP
jgi:hypothetical protein